MPPASACVSILVPEETRGRAGDILDALRTGAARPGARLRARLEAAGLDTLSPLDLLGLLFDTKEPQIFAESQVAGDGSDWTLDELGLLGDVSVAVPVTVFDDGNHTRPTPHETPFPATLVFTPGALLRNDRGLTPADWPEVTTADGRLDPEGYFQLYRRRLLPVFQYIDAHAPGPRSALVTIPGLGCGQFAGPFRGRLAVRLQSVLERLLEEHGDEFPNIRAVYYDPYGECSNARLEIRGISLLVRPLTAPGNARKSQLCRPPVYAEPGDDFSGCTLASLVAWDHVSWPGNDFYLGARATDDGVKAAATSSMQALTGVVGSYDRSLGKFQPPHPYSNWKEVVIRNGLPLWDPTAVWRVPDGR